MSDVDLAKAAMMRLHLRSAENKFTQNGGEREGGRGGREGREDREVKGVKMKTALDDWVAQKGKAPGRGDNGDNGDNGVRIGVGGGTGRKVGMRRRGTAEARFNGFNGGEGGGK